MPSATYRLIAEAMAERKQVRVPAFPLHLREADNKRQFAPNSQGYREAFEEALGALKPRAAAETLERLSIYGNATNSTQFGFLPVG